MKYNVKYYIILTNDYEVFGDGSGNVNDILIQPTDEILTICNRHGVPITFFFDVLEYNAFRKAENANLFGTDYKAATMILNQVQGAKKAGHDIQLHLHPQWIRAVPNKEDNWRINRQYWRLPMVPGGLGSFDDPESLRGLFRNGKIFLENILKPIEPEYECIAFRAGGYCIQPEGGVLRAMRESGLRVDSSVCPGRYMDRPPAYFDFRAASTTLPYWRISERVDEKDDNGDLLELPVAVGRQSRIKTCHKKGESSLSALRRFLLPRVVNLDYCKLAGAELIEMTECYIGRMDKTLNAQIPLPIVLIGHSKEWTGTGALDQYLEWVATQPEMAVMTVTEWLKQHDEELTCQQVESK